VALARAVLKGAEIFLLDEATSSLDSENERLIQEAIDETVRGRTALVIAHRLSTIQNADTIAFLDGGRIVECGTWQEMLSRGGRFHDAWDAQRIPLGAELQHEGVSAEADL
jgi:ABC-type multidrug transport system fused ATPase/permease subunit